MRMEHRTTAEAGNKGWRIQLESGEFQEVEEGEEPFCTPRMQLDVGTQHLPRLRLNGGFARG